MFTLKKKPQTIHYVSLSFDPAEKTVRFDPVFKLFRKYDLRVFSTKFRSADGFADHRHVITFGFTGAYVNTRKFLKEFETTKSLQAFKRDRS